MNFGVITKAVLSSNVRVLQEFNIKFVHGLMNPKQPDVPILSDVQDISEAGLLLAKSLIHMFIPQYYTVNKTTEEKVYIPPTYTWIDDFTRPIYKTISDTSPGEYRYGEDLKVVIGYHKKQIVAQEGYEKTVYDEHPDVIQSVMKSTFEAFRLWSSIPILQVGFAGGLLAAGIKFGPSILSSMKNSKVQDTVMAIDRRGS